MTSRPYSPTKSLRGECGRLKLHLEPFESKALAYLVQSIQRLNRRLRSGVRRVRL